MPTTALYHWSVAGCPVNVLIELPAVERLRAAALRAEQEIGGLLIGAFDGNYTIVSDFEEIESEHRRGIGYQLSSRDERKMAGRVESWAHRKNGNVVGFFRSHRRPGLYLDESDNGLLSSYFHNPQQIALLVKPEAGSAANGGFFFWEDGEMNRKQTYLQFPMDARQLEEGDFPLVEPVDSGEPAHGSISSPVMPPGAALLPEPLEDWRPAQLKDEPAVVATSARNPVAFEYADTLDELPGARIIASEAVTEPRTSPAGVRRTVLPPPRPAERQAGLGQYRWPVYGAIAALIAFGGYIWETSTGHNDQFGARKGDIAVDSQPPAPEPAPAPLAKLEAAKPESAVAVSQRPHPGSLPAQRPAPVPVGAAQPNRVALSPPKPLSKPVPAVTAPVHGGRKSVSAVLASKPAPAPIASTGATLPENPAPEPTPSHLEQPANPAVASNEPSARPGFAWSHYASPIPAARSAARRESVAEAAISVEPAESGALKRVAHRIPLFGSIGGKYEGGDDFTPAQPVHTFAPKVPPELAQGLTSTLPIDLKLKLDKNGRVRSVEVMSKQKAPQFVQLAGGAAYQWQFEPAHLKEKSVPSEVIAHFRFRPAM